VTDLPILRIWPALCNLTMMLEETVPRSSSLPPHMRLALTVSVLLHIIFLVLLNKAPTPQDFEPLSFEVSIEPPLKRTPKPEQKIERQIVTPPTKTSAEKAPEDSRFLSDTDVAAPKEQIKRGDDPNAGPKVAVQKQASPPSPPIKSQAQKKEAAPKPEAVQKGPPPRIKQLTLDQGTLVEKFVKEQAEASAKPLKNNSPQTVDLRSYEAFSRPSGSGAAVFGLQGSNDYIPYLPDGDVTLLNAKAEKFAVFVRRVALQVFSNIRQAGWDQLAPGDIRAISDFITITAVLSPKGQLIGVNINTPSGSQRFDGVIKDAVNRGARDSNPPPQAVADDGNIHFIFKARSWSQGSFDRRTGAPFERRWLLLATGLE
jgi:hypothetical protein